MKIYYVMLLIIFLLLSCDKSKEFVSCICNKHVKYWDLIEDDLTCYKYKHGYCFFKSGHYVYYHYLDGERFEQKASDVYVKNTWWYINDTTMNLGGAKVRIIKLTEDSVILQWADKSTVRLVKSRDQTANIKPQLKIEYKIIYDTISNSSGIHYKKKIIPISPKY